jgi:hypothetical protein
MIVRRHIQFNSLAGLTGGYSRALVVCVRA